MIINNSNFKIKEIPDFHPIAESYERDEWWRIQKRRCMEGYWVSGKWMPPELYYYINFHNILFEDGIYRGMGLPWLRDIDWEKAYIYAEATGFSGFELDDEYTCHRFIKENVPDERILKFCTLGDSNKVDKSYLNNFYKKDGSRKTYVEARDYLRKIHLGNLGKPLYFNEAQHIIELASRGYGKSYYASGLIAHNFIFDGARDYDLHLRLRQEGKPLQTDTVVGAIDAKYSNKLIGKVKVALEKLPGSKFVNMHGEQVYFPSPLAISYTGSFAIGREATATNSKSVVQHVTFADNPLAAAGGRPNKVFIDEVGFMNVIKEAWEGIENTQAAADFKRLTIYGMGTGGLTVGGAVTYLQEIFYNPEAYGCLAFDDKWENKGKIGYFVPGTMALNQFKEGPNLITNEEKALEYINAERDKAKKSKSSTKMQGTIINKPIVPSEIFLRMEGTYFPTHELKQALAELESNKLLLRASYKAELIESIKNVIKLEPSEKQVITEYPMKRGQSMDAPVEIFEKPKLDTDGHVFDNRYIASCLPPGEKVLTDKGLKNVEDITFKSKLVNKDGNYVEINKLIRHNLKDENIYELKVANTYRKTKFTSEHPILVSKEKTGYVSYPRSVRLGINQRYKKFDFKFKQISEITEGEWIKVPNIYKKLNDFDITELWDNNTYRIDRQIENPLNKEAFWWFVGIWLGDGWCNKNGYTISVCFNEKEEQYINKFKKVVSTLFNRKVSIVSNPGSKTLIFNHQQLNRFLTKHFGKYAIGKNLPEWSKKIDISLKRNLILGYLDSDGSILKNKDYWSTEFVSISLNLLEGFQDVLFSLGIISSITKLRNERKADIRGIMCNIQKTYHLRIGHGDSLKLKELLNKPKNLKLSRIIKEELPILTKRTPIINCFLSDDNNYIYFKIEKIVKSKYTGTVYNFECDTHTFMCHHITTHNCDPVDDDGNSDITRSLQSSFILDTWTNKIVAEYTARTYLVDEYYENLRKLIVYYNAKLLYEANKKGLYGYFKNKNSLYLLNEVPEILKDQDLIKSVGIGNRSLGVNVSNDKIKFYAINLILKWLEAPSYNNPDKKNLYTIRSLGLLKELISFSMDINADRVSSLMILMIFREELDRRIEQRKQTSVKSAAQSDFWGRAYGGFNKDKVHRKLKYLANYDVN